MDKHIRNDARQVMISESRTENDLKNKFYGGLRKFIRKANTVIKSTFQNLKKELKYCSVYRIIDASDSLITLPEELMCKSIDLKHRILECSHTENKEISDGEILNLVEEINQFNLKTRSYKPKKLEKFKKENICKSETESKVGKAKKNGFLSEPPRKKPASLEEPSLSVDELTIDLVEIPDVNPSSVPENMMMIIDDLKSYQEENNVFNEHNSLDSLLQDMGEYGLEGENWFEERI